MILRPCYLSQLAPIIIVLLVTLAACGTAHAQQPAPAIVKPEIPKPKIAKPENSKPGIPVTGKPGSGQPGPPKLKTGIVDKLRQHENLDAMAKLGEKIFHDTSLSSPAGIACASCHDANTGFADPIDMPVSRGAISNTTFGSRNAPTAAYAAFIPEPQEVVFAEQGRHLIGGQFWDGRAANLVEQAKMPFLDPLEMNQPDAVAVVDAVSKSAYDAEFRNVFGDDIYSDADMAFTSIAMAIAAFEMTPRISPFNSKYDAVKRGAESFTAQEARGEELFHDKAQCARCHFTPEHFGPQVFSTFQYFNIGTPVNYDSPFVKKDKKFRDYGLYNVTGKNHHKGLFRVPTLRNVELTAPYLHNGIFNTLEEVVKFYSKGGDAPEYATTVADDGFYNTGITITDQEIADIVAFLKTLTDRPPEIRQAKSD